MACKCPPRRKCRCGEEAIEAPVLVVKKEALGTIQLGKKASGPVVALAKAVPKAPTMTSARRTTKVRRVGVAEPSPASELLQGLSLFPKFKSHGGSHVVVAGRAPLREPSPKPYTALPKVEVFYDRPAPLRGMGVRSTATEGFDSGWQTARLPRPITSIIANPGMGLQKVFYYNANRELLTDVVFPDGQVVQSLSSYCRVYWSEVESAEGTAMATTVDAVTRWLQIEGRSARDRLSLRIMPYGKDTYKLAGGVDAHQLGSDHVPAWFQDQSDPSSGAPISPKGGNINIHTVSDPRWRYVPDYLEDPGFAGVDFPEAMRRLVAGVAAGCTSIVRRLDFVDVGLVGNTGEWYTADAEKTLGPVNWRYIWFDPLEPDVTAVMRQNALLDLEGIVLGSFPGIPIVMQLAVPRLTGRSTPMFGCGWRADSLGSHFFTKSGLSGSYADWIRLADIASGGDYFTKRAWQAGPVIFETADVMSRWPTSDWPTGSTLGDVALESFNFALENHACYFGTKGEQVEWPEAVLTAASSLRFFEKLGYRLVPKHLAHPASVRRATMLTLVNDWSNDGVACLYGDYWLTLRLTPASGGTSVDVHFRRASTLLPGLSSFVDKPAIPGTLTPGTYRVELGVVGPERLAYVQLAVEGAADSNSEFWYPLGTTLEVTA